MELSGDSLRFKSMSSKSLRKESKMNNRWWNLMTVGILFSLIGCSSSGGQLPVANASIAQSSKPRVTSPNASPSDRADAANGNNAFAFDLYRFLRKDKQDSNLFYSPYSISLALAMTYAGARGQTEQQMAQTLHLLPQARAHTAFNGLDLELAKRGQGAKGKDSKGFRLNIANALWGQSGYRFLPEFLDVLAENYGSGLRLLDFAADPESSRVTINNWISDQTEGRIKDLIPQGAFDKLTRLVLTNAIYFNAAWATPFEESQTQDSPFHLQSGGQVTVPMMKQTESFGYAEGPNYQAVELPYDGRELSMVILLPKSGQFDAFEGTLDAGQVNTILKDLKPHQVVLTLPRFKVESEFNLAATLAAMGMPSAFSSEADFSGMDGGKNLFISDVIHKAFVTVDEAGTEAAATAVVMVGLASVMPEQPVEVTVDRPSVFLIRDIQTGTILFVGRIVNPS
jgi:serpin B